MSLQALERPPPRRQVARLAETQLSTAVGAFRCIAFVPTAGGPTHLALVKGDVDGQERVLVRVHSECLTGDVLSSLHCDCGKQLDEALRRIVAAGEGVLIYLRGHEGRGIGLLDKIRAYGLQAEGLDTVEANLALGLPSDARDYAAAGAMLRELRVGSVCLLTNNPSKVTGLEASGIVVDAQEPLIAAAGPESIAYLRAKRDRLGHQLGGLAL